MILRWANLIELHKISITLSLAMESRDKAAKKLNKKRRGGGGFVIYIYIDIFLINWVFVFISDPVIEVLKIGDLCFFDDEEEISTGFWLNSLNFHDLK